MTLTERDIMRVAAEASVDPRTVRKYIAGKKVRRLVAERLTAALAKLELAAAPAKEAS